MHGRQVYWGNGCQIVPPVDRQIAEAIEANLRPWPDVRLGAPADVYALPGAGAPGEGARGGVGGAHERPLG